MRRHVTPAEPAAAIPDPERGDNLPADGRPVTWNAYWAGLALRGDITFEDIEDAPAEAQQPPPASPAKPDKPLAA